MRNIIKIIAINVFLLFSFLGVLTTGPLLLQVVYDGYQRLNPFLVDGDALAANAKIDLTPNLDLYKEVDWEGNITVYEAKTDSEARSSQESPSKEEEDD